MVLYQINQFQIRNSKKSPKKYHLIYLFLCLFLTTTTFASNEIDSLEQLLITLPTNKEKVDVLNELSFRYHRKDIEKTSSYAEEALKLSREINYPKGRAYAIHYLSIAHSISGDSEQGKALNSIAIGIADSLQDNTLRIRTYNVKAFILTNEGKPEAAVKVYQDALDLSIEEKNNKGVISIQLNIGEIHAQNKEFSKARDYYQSAIQLAQETNKSHLLAWGYGLIATTYSAEKAYKKATTYLKKAIKTAAELKDNRSVSSSKSKLAKVYLETGKTEAALQQTLEAIDLIKEVGDNEVLAGEYIDLLDIYLKVNQPQKAIKTAIEGIRLTSETGNIRQKIQIQALLAKAYAMVEDFQKAYKLNVQTQSTIDSLDLSTKKNLVAELEEKYQSKKKEAENTLLRAEQTHQTAVIAQQKSINTYLSIVAFLLALLGYLAFDAYRSKQRNNLLLEEKVAARTLQLQKTNTQLVQSNEELSRFAYVASHDLREPLRNITNFTQLLQRVLQSSEKEEVSQFMDIIIKNTAHMNNLIIDTLEFTQLSNKAVKKTAVDINHTIKNITSSIADTLKKRKAIIDIQQALPTVYANEGLLFSVFKNLIENSITYNESGAPIISINYSTREKEYLFSVNDNGIGIPKEYQETVFEMFKRLQNREKYEGSGMGLANCKKIVDKLGGKIWVESDGTNGSTFFFTLPKREKKKVAINETAVERTAVSM